MATSGSTTYSQTRIDLVKGALRLAGVLDGAEAPKAEDADAANAALNLYLKAFQSKAPQLWRQDQGVLFLTPGTESYNLGTGGDRATRQADFASTELAANAALGASTITVDSASGFTSGDQIGIELSDGTRQWTTVSGAPVGAVITLAAVLTGAASSGGTVYGYTTILSRPNRITHMVRRCDSVDIEVQLVSRQEHFNAPTKTQEGSVLQAYYSPQITRGILYVWPTGADVNETLRFTYERTLEDMLANDDDFDLPQEWLECFKFGLAYRLALEFGAPISKVQILKGESEQREQELLDYDQEYASIYFSPDLTRRGR